VRAGFDLSTVASIEAEAPQITCDFTGDARSNPGPPVVHLGAVPNIGPAAARHRTAVLGVVLIEKQAQLHPIRKQSRARWGRRRRPGIETATWV
jgi:hypothetical protein